MADIALTINADAHQDLEENFAKKKNVSMIAQNTEYVKITNVFVLMDFLGKIAPYMSAQIIAVDMDHVIVKQENLNSFIRTH